MLNEEAIKFYEKTAKDITKRWFNNIINISRDLEDPSKLMNSFFTIGHFTGNPLWNSLSSSGWAEFPGVNNVKSRAQFYRTEGDETWVIAKDVEIDGLEKFSERGFMMTWSIFSTAAHSTSWIEGNGKIKEKKLDNCLSPVEIDLNPTKNYLDLLVFDEILEKNLTGEWGIWKKLMR